MSGSAQRIALMRVGAARASITEARRRAQLGELLAVRAFGFQAVHNLQEALRPAPVEWPSSRSP